MRVPNTLSAGSFVAALAFACSQQPAVETGARPGRTAEGITSGDLKTRLYIYADDSMMGREAGTIGNFKGTTYIAAEAARIGLEPAGENGTFFQNMTATSARFAGSPNPEWARNVVAAGGASLRWKGRDVELGHPRIVDGAAAERLAKAPFRPVLKRFPAAIVLERRVIE